MNKLTAAITVGPVVLEKGEDMQALQQLIDVVISVNSNFTRELRNEMSGVKATLSMQKDMLHRIQSKLGVSNRIGLNYSRVEHQESVKSINAMRKKIGHEKVPSPPRPPSLQESLSPHKHLQRSLDIRSSVNNMPGA